ncbi:hypothetical protein [Haloplanus halophilus]|uniref:hypothetical protein n=1 Tax=Haloplanus halophilus TaxID=2949993 RepID=UPI0020422091|nr:hypothetical protein [Haloplanus sp. GDY1]
MPSNVIIENVILAARWIGWILLGGIVHELWHFVFGKIFGGGTFYSRYTFGLYPTQVDFKTPKAMTDWQVRVTGIVGMIFWIPLFAGLWLHIPWLILLGMGGGLTISASDMNAIHHPEAWKKLTADESVTLADFESKERGIFRPLRGFLRR